VDVTAKVKALFGADFQPPPVAQLIGFRITDLDRGTCTVELDAGRKHHNPMGTVHGGIVTDIADAAMGIACASTLNKGESFTTLELKLNFMRPVFEELLKAVGTVVHRGRSVVVVECTVTNREGKLVAKGTSTCQVIAGGGGSQFARDQK
jgi:uncharacterized protein (TIGR00369 family)